MGYVNNNVKNSKKKLFQFNSWQKLDKMLLIPILILLIFSIIFVYSTTNHLGINNPNYKGPYELVIKQFVFSILGIIAYFIVLQIPTSVYKKLWQPIVITTIVLMIVPLFFEDSNGAHRWIPGPVSFQPSEFAKIVIILIWSVAMSSKVDDFKIRWNYLMQKKASPKRLAKRVWLSWKIPILFTLALLMLFRLQSDNGSLMISLGLIIIIIFASGALPQKALKIFWGILFVSVLALGGAYIFFSSLPQEQLLAMGKSNYVLGRFVSWANPLAFYEDLGYQVSNSLMAIANGGLFGRGIGKGIQKQGFLTEGHNDFILANIVEEIGIVGVSVIFLLYILIIYRSLKVARESKNSFDSLLVTGITTLFFFQAFWNSGGVVGLLPLKGLTAPLISYGGTSIVILLAALAVIQRVSIQNNIPKKKKKVA